jgi:hypothetical protein
MISKHTEMQLLNEIQHVRTNAGGDKRPAFPAGRLGQPGMTRVQSADKETMVCGRFPSAGGSSHGLSPVTEWIMP